MIKVIKIALAISCLVSGFSAFAAVFTSEPLSKHLKIDMIKSKNWSPECPVSLDRLSLLTISYYDFHGHEKIGKLLIFDGAANLTLDAFKKMYNMHYPLEEVTVNEPLTEEETAAYTCRNIVGGGSFSQHAYGLAIDINVARNPYIGEFKIADNGQASGSLIPTSKKSYAYLNRAIQRPGMNEQIVSIMQQAGYARWGGEWEDRVDYQHFEVPKNIGENLIYLDKHTAEEFLKLTILYPESAKKMSTDSRWRYLYALYPQQYLNALQTFFPLLSTEDEKAVINQVYEKLANS